MSFDKHMGKEHRKPYRGSKAHDRTCRNHGGCPACLSNRTISHRKYQQSADDQLKQLGDDHDGDNNIYLGE